MQSLVAILSQVVHKEHAMSLSSRTAPQLLAAFQGTPESGIGTQEAQYGSFRFVIALPPLLSSIIIYFERWDCLEKNHPFWEPFFGTGIVKEGVQCV